MLQGLLHLHPRVSTQSPTSVRRRQKSNDAKRRASTAAEQRVGSHISYQTTPTTASSTLPWLWHWRGGTGRTPAAASFFGTLQLLRDCMFDGSSVLSSVQVSARASRGFIFTNSGFPGAGAQMGAVASVFEGVVRACPENGSYLWPQDLGDRRRRVVSTRHAFGLDWRYSNNCGIGDYSSREVTPDQSASLRNATVITIPNGSSASFQEKVLGFFSSGLASDLSIPGESPCRSCADCVQQTLCDWTFLPSTAVTGPDRLFFRSSSVFQGLPGLPMSASLTLTMGVEYSLVGVSYHFAVGGVERNHFISQLRVRGRWHKYDCLAGGPVVSSDQYDSEWHTSSRYNVVCRYSTGVRRSRG